MALKAVLASIDGLSDAVKGEYTKGDDGRFYLAVEGIDEMPAVAGLKKKNLEVLDEKKKLEDKVKALGVSTPEEVEELRKQAKANNSEKVTQLENQLKQVSENSQKEILNAKDEAKAERDAARRYFEDGEITRALGAHKGIPELLSHVVRQHIKSERAEDGTFRLQVVGKDGQARIKDSAGNAFSVDDLVAELKQDQRYGMAFEAEGRTGSGASQGGGGGGGGGSASSVRAGDLEAFGANLEGIAKGTVTVVAS